MVGEQMKYVMKQNTIEAKKVTIENMSMVETWCRGSIKGTALPENERIIAVQTPMCEEEAEVGDYILHFKGVGFFVLKAPIFEEIYQEVK